MDTVHPRSGYFPWVYNWVQLQTTKVNKLSISGTRIFDGNLTTDLKLDRQKELKTEPLAVAIALITYILAPNPMPLTLHLIQGSAACTGTWGTWVWPWICWGGLLVNIYKQSLIFPSNI
jgi:hypothetical protein